MSRIEVLCATMHQTDIETKYKQMNIQTDAVFGNQADRFSFEVKSINNHTVKMITTPFRGVGNNRNFALLNATANICMFADDDIVYSNDYEKFVLEAYEALPDADLIIFNCHSSKDKRYEINKISRVRFWNFLRYGTVRITARTESLKRSDIMFTQMFGGGCPYGAGEDSKFLKEAIFKGLKVYAHPYFLACINEETSTWFEGYNSKYFYDHGALLGATFPVLKYSLMIYYYIKYKRKNLGSGINTLSLMMAGVRGYKKGITYNQWTRRTK